MIHLFKLKKNMSNLEKHLMSPDQSIILAEEYLRTNYVEINSRRPASKPDSKTYSIDLEVLKEYLKLIDEEMEKRGITNKGVRVTLGKYPENLKDPKLNPEYLGYQMIFFSPTDLDENQNKSINKEASPKSDEIPDLNYMNVTPPF